MKDSKAKLLLPLVNPESSLADSRDQKRIYWLSLAFFVMAAGYNAAQNYITTLLGSDGNYSLVSLYFFLGLSALFGPRSLQLIRGQDSTMLLHGEKRALIIGCFCYAPYLASLALGNMLWVQLATAGLLGTGSGILWITQGSIMATCSRPHNRDRMAGLFWGVYQTGCVAGNLLGFLVHALVPSSSAVLFLMCTTLVLIATNLHLFTFQPRELREIHRPVASSASSRPYKPFLASGSNSSSENAPMKASNSDNDSVISSHSKPNSTNLNSSDNASPSVAKKLKGAGISEKGTHPPQSLLGNETSGIGRSGLLDSISALSDWRKGTAESKLVFGSVTLSDKSNKLSSNNSVTQSQTDAIITSQAKELDTVWGSIRAVMRLLTVPQSLLLCPMCLFIGVETGYWSGTFPTFLAEEDIGFVLGIMALGEVVASFLIGPLVECTGQAVALCVGFACMGGGVFLSLWGTEAHRDGLLLFNIPVVDFATALLLGFADAILNTLTAARFGSLADDWHLFHPSAAFAFYQLFNSAAVAASMGYAPSLPLQDSMAQIWILAGLGSLAFVGFLLGQPKGSPPLPRVRVSMFASVLSQKAAMDPLDNVIENESC